MGPCPTPQTRGSVRPLGPEHTGPPPQEKGQEVRGAPPTPSDAASQCCHAERHTQRVQESPGQRETRTVQGTVAWQLQEEVPLGAQPGALALCALCPAQSWFSETLSDRQVR